MSLLLEFCYANVKWCLCNICIDTRRMLHMLLSPLLYLYEWIETSWMKGYVLHLKFCNKTRHVCHAYLLDTCIISWKKRERKCNVCYVMNVNHVTSCMYVCHMHRILPHHSKGCIVMCRSEKITFSRGRVPFWSVEIWFKVFKMKIWFEVVEIRFKYSNYQDFRRF